MHHFKKTVGYTSKYNIAWKGLKEGITEYVYLIDAEFFEQIDKSLVEKAEVLARVTIEKRNLVFTFGFELEGTVELTCDRCLEKYNQFIKQQVTLLIRIGDGLAEPGDDVIWISPGEDFINLAQLLYEYIVLSIPVRHVHPKDKNGKSLCNPEMLKQIEKYSTKESEPAKDHRWDELKKLMHTN